MSANPAPEAIASAAFTRRDWFEPEVTRHILRECGRALVTPVGILLDRLHHDGIEVAAHGGDEARAGAGAQGGDARLIRTRGAELRAGRRGILGADGTQEPLDGGAARFQARLRDERRLPGEQLIKDHAERIDIGERGDLLLARGLLGTHVKRRADALDGKRLGARRGEVATVEHLGDAKVDDLRRRSSVLLDDHDIARLEVAVDDAVLMRVMHRAADRREEFQPRCDRQLALVARHAQRLAAQQLHCEKRTPICRRAAVEYLGDIRMIHPREHLLLELEAGEDLRHPHLGLQKFDGHLPVQPQIARLPDDSECALADLFHETEAFADDLVLLEQPALEHDLHREDRGGPRRHRHRLCAAVGGSRHLQERIGSLPLDRRSSSRLGGMRRRIVQRLRGGVRIGGFRRGHGAVRAA